MLSKATKLVLTFSLFTFGACTSKSYQGAEPSPDTVRQVNLAEATKVSELVVVGVTVEPNSERVLILDATRGVYALGADETATLVWGNDLTRYGVSIGSAWTDIVALEDGVFALTALSDGYLLDLNKDTLTQHFCYEPGWEEEPPPEPVAAQITDAVTYDAKNNLIYAQPRSVGGDLATVYDSSLALYDRRTGADLVWVDFDVDYVATAMAMEDEDNILLGRGSLIERYVVGPNRLTRVMDLSAIGVSDIQGMAIAPGTGNLLVVDGATASLVEIVRPL